MFGSGGKLIRPSVPVEEFGAGGLDFMAVVPGFDGTLYYILPAPAGEGGGDSSGIGAAARGLVAHKLPLNALDVTDDPRTLCSELDLDLSPEGRGSGCGLVVGERSTKLFALDVDNGSVRWVREAHTGVIHRRSAEDEGDARPEPMLLQRDEYTVRYSSLADGSEHWNVSVALFSKVDVAHFEELDGAVQPVSAQAKLNWARGGWRTPDHLGLPDGAALPPKHIAAAAALPRLLLTPLAGQGEGEGAAASFLLEALDAAGEVLWTRRLPEAQAVASVFGVAAGTWVPIDPSSRDDAAVSDAEGNGAGGDGAGGGSAGLLDGPPLVGGDASTQVMKYERWDEQTRNTLHMTPSGVVFVLPSRVAAVEPSPSAVAVSPLGGLVALGDRRRRSDSSRNRNRFWVQSQPSALAIGPPEVAPSQGLLFPQRPTTSGGPTVGGGGSVELSMNVIALVVLVVVLAAGGVALAAFRLGRTKASSPRAAPAPAPGQGSAAVAGAAAEEQPMAPLVALGDAAATPAVKPAPDARPDARPSLAIPEATPKLAHVSSSDPTGSPMNRSTSLPSMLQMARSVSAPASVSASVHKEFVPERSLPERSLGHPPIAEESSLNSTPSPFSSPKLGPAHPSLLPPPPPAPAHAPGHTTLGHTAGHTSRSESAASSRPINPAVSAKWSTAPRYVFEFEELRSLGVGGFGTVHQARNRMDGQDYAIKKVRLSSRHFGKVEKVLREVVILAQLDNKHIIRYFQAWIEHISDAEQAALASELRRAKAAGVSLPSSWDTTTRAEPLPPELRRCESELTSNTDDQTFDDDSTLGEMSAQGCLDRSVTWSEGASKSSQRLRQKPRRRGGQQRLGSRSFDSSRSVKEVNESDQSEKDEWSALPLWSGDDPQNGSACRDHGSDLSLGSPARLAAPASLGSLSPIRSPGRLTGLDLMRSSPRGRVPSSETSGELSAPTSPPSVRRVSPVAGLPPPISCPSPFDLDADPAADPTPDPASVAKVKGADEEAPHQEQRQPRRRRVAAVWRGEDSPSSEGSVGSWTDELGSDSDGSTSASESTDEDDEDDAESSTLAAAAEALVVDVEGEERSMQSHSGSTLESTNSADGPIAPLDARPLDARGGSLDGHSRGKQWRGQLKDSKSTSSMTSSGSGFRRGKFRRDRAGGVSRHRRSARGDVDDDGGGGWGEGAVDEAGSTSGSPTAASHDGKRGGRRGRKDRPAAQAPYYDLVLYIQMQYCSKDTLRDFLDARDKVDVDAALNIFSQIARGIEYVHSKSMIHRDLKPSNCFFMGDGTVKVGDFGLSRSAAHDGAPKDKDGQAARARRQSEALDDDAVSPPPTPLTGPVAGPDATAAGDITAGIGTRLYASPEQTAGGDYDEATDIYSLGIMLFEMCHASFGTGMERAVVLRDLAKQQLPDAWPVSGSHPTVAALILSMLSPDPRLRPSAHAVVERVANIKTPGPLVLSRHLRQHQASEEVVLRVEVHLPHADGPSHGPSQEEPQEAPQEATQEATPQASAATAVAAAAGEVASEKPCCECPPGGSVPSPVVGPYSDPSTEALHQIRGAIFAAAPGCKVASYGVRESSGVEAIIEFILANLNDPAAVAKAVAALPSVREVKVL